VARASRTHRQGEDGIKKNAGFDGTEHAKSFTRRSAESSLSLFLSTGSRYLKMRNVCLDVNLNSIRKT
jgi:hypothetical protein